MDFKERIQKAANRGQRSKEARDEAAARQAMDEEECRRRHSAQRIALSEHIEQCLKQLADNFPGFRFETVVDDTGWGAAISRDDLVIDRGKRNNAFSRLKVVVGPYSPKYQVLSIAAKGAVRNKESFVRNHFEPIADLDEDRFRELIELWVLDYAEDYASA